jgi:hypothetical protein
MVEYTLIAKDRVQSRVRKRYESEISALCGLGFSGLTYCLEDHGPYSALSLLLTIPLALYKREILLLRRPLRLACANVLLSAEEPASIALCMGMGVKIYSMLSDGTVVVSSDFVSSATPGVGSRVVRLPAQPTLERAWAAHRLRVLGKEADVGPLSEATTLEHYAKMSALEDDLSQYVSAGARGFTAQCDRHW